MYTSRLREVDNLVKSFSMAQRRKNLGGSSGTTVGKVNISRTRKNLKEMDKRNEDQNGSSKHSESIESFLPNKDMRRESSHCDIGSGCRKDIIEGRKTPVSPQNRKIEREATTPESNRQAYNPKPGEKKPSRFYFYKAQQS